MDWELRAFLALTRRLPRIRGAGVVSEALRSLYNRIPREEVEAEMRGLLMNLRPEECVEGGLLFHPHLYEARELDFVLSELRVADTFVDLGANVGLYSLLAARAVGPGGRVFAVEADPETAQRLTRNSRMNGLEVQIAVAGVSDVEEDLSLAVDQSGNRGGSSFVRNSSRSVKVHCRPLLDLVREAGLQRIDGLKADIEGFEHRVLKRFFKDCPLALRPRFLLVELNPEFDDGNLQPMLEGLGYRLVFRTTLNGAFKAAV